VKADVVARLVEVDDQQAVVRSEVVQQRRELIAEPLVGAHEATRLTVGARESCPSWHVSGVMNANCGSRS
jgi:hypothetical protein